MGSGLMDMLRSGEFLGWLGVGSKAPGSTPPPAQGAAPVDSREDYFKIAGAGLHSLANPQNFQPIGMRRGGIAKTNPKMSGPNDKAVTTAAIAALQGRHANPQLALATYLKRHGTTAFRDLVDKVRSGTPLKQDGRVSGPGDGMSDNVPAQGPGASDILLADGEYIVPADVVSGLGNGSTDAGVRRLKEMEARVREARTGTTEQPAAVPPEKALPV